jgi:toxin ParE1/3/4
LVLSPAARDDLEQIARYVAEAAGVVIAIRAVDRIHAILRLLRETPGELGRVREEIGAGIRSFPVRPHMVFFRYGDREVQVIRFLHERQDVDQELGDKRP